LTAAKQALADESNKHKIIFTRAVYMFMSRCGMFSEDADECKPDRLRFSSVLLPRHPSESQYG
jgi:hypothetical protein